MHLKHWHKICLTLLAAAGLSQAAMALSQEVYGPINLVKTLPNPFGAPGESDKANVKHDRAAVVKPIAIGSQRASPFRRSLSERLVGVRLYLPGRLVLGKPAEFVVKGRPGANIALAMADRDSGAKEIHGRKLRLGPDRKVVSVGIVPASGVLSLVIETPVQGDLVGQFLFFEAASWKAPDFSDLELAVPVTSEGQEGIQNGVMVAAEAERKRGLKIVPDAAIPLQQRSGSTGLDSGKL